MVTVTEKLVPMLEKLTNAVFVEFVGAGGIIKDGENDLSPKLLSSSQGGLPALMFVAREFYVDTYALPFAKFDYRADADAHTGYSVKEIVPDHQAAFVVLAWTSFLRDEIVPKFAPGTTPVMDFSVMFANFKEWCHSNVAPNAPDPSNVKGLRPE